MNYDNLFKIVNHPFNGDRGWIALDTIDHLKIETKKYLSTYEELGYVCKQEVVTHKGVIWVYLEKKNLT